MYAWNGDVCLAFQVAGAGALDLHSGRARPAARRARGDPDEPRGAGGGLLTPRCLLCRSRRRRSCGSLVKELCVMSRKEILPTYKIPALVRAPEGQVDHERGPPIAGEHPARRGQERPIPVAKCRPADRLSTRTWWRATAFSSWSSDTVASPVSNPTRRRGWSRQRIARHEGCYLPASNRAEPSIGSPQARRACSTDRATNRFREHLCRVGSTGVAGSCCGVIVWGRWPDASCRHQ
jgi:hypothetical protein